MVRNWVWNSLSLSSYFRYMFNMIGDDLDSCLPGGRNEIRCEVDLLAYGNKRSKNVPSMKRKRRNKQTMTTASFCPSPVPINFRMSSGTLRGTSYTALAEEWDQITGALEYFRACAAVASDVCDRSTRTPSRFISSINDRPSSLDHSREK